MPTTTPGQGFRVPVATDDPDVVDDMTQLAKGIEKRVMGIYATAATRDSAGAAMGLEEGMFAYTRDTDTTWRYTGSAWVVFPAPGPVIRSGSAAPVNSTGVDGDVYFRY